MNTKNVTLIAVSALALSTSFAGPVFSQVIISCPQRLTIGNIILCSTGRLVINPDGTTTSMTGCAHVTNTPTPAQCVVQTGGMPVASNVRVDFAASSVTITKAGDTILIDRLRMTYTGATTPATAITLTPAQVSGGVTVNIGGRLNMSGTAQTLGVYSSNITVQANTI